MEIAEIQELAKAELNEILMAIDDDSLSKYGKDTYSLYESNPSLIVFPKDIDEVVKIVVFANKYLIPIVPSGGRTGLCGGATATNGEIVLSSEKLVNEPEFFQEEDTVDVMAGTVTKDLQKFAKEKGLLFPIDFTATGSSNIGGNIATNAGGIYVIQYGLMRNWVLGITVVTGKGEILNLNKGLTKNATGYDLRQLFIGSEGTLGLIVKASIKLTRPPVNTTTLLLGFYDLDDVTKILGLFKKNVDLLAFEFFTNEALQVALDEDVFKFALDEQHRYYIIAEYEKVFNFSEGADKEIRDRYVINIIIESGLVLEGKIASSQSERELFWKHRENIPTALNKFSPYKNDISIRIRFIPGFIKKLDEIIKSNYEFLKVLWFGHIGDGNLHINIIKPKAMEVDEFRIKCEDLSVKLYKLIKLYEGSISAEHGVGLSKKNFLIYSKSKEEIAYMRSIKNIFDPNNILNPNKIFNS